MKDSTSKIALAMIVKGTDEEALLLDRCLQTLAPYVDGIFITRTQPNKAVGNVAKIYKAHLSDFEWNYNFADARNFNFSQVPKDYDWIMWSDADDVWRGMEKLRPTLEKHKRVEAFGIWYLYDWDEAKLPTVVHRKTMIIKNDGCAKWEGAIHEDLQPTRTVETYLIEGIQRLHLSNTKRSTENAQRNLEIAKHEVRSKNEDPRSFWNLANAQFGVSDFENARRNFVEFIETSNSMEEVYIARTRLANVYKALGNRSESIKELQLAIGLMPSIPDAYFQLASYFYDFDNMAQAEHYVLQGMRRRPQIMKMVVYNPRDYDYNPMMLAAHIYNRLGRYHDSLIFLKGCLKIYPKDKALKQAVKQGEKDKALLAKALTHVKKLQKIKNKTKLLAELHKLSPEMQSHPHVVQLRNQNFIKTESSGRDLVIYCGNTMEQWNPDLFKTKMVGGSEEAVIHMAEELARLGWRVTVYNNCGHKEMQCTIENSDIPVVVYKPFWEFNLRDKQDVVILWRWAKPLDAEINAPKIFLDLHDVIPEGELTPARLNRVTKIFVKSNFHRSLFPNVPDDKFAIIPNGLEIYPDAKIKKDPYLVINTSSPDRSMDVLPKLFKEVKKRVPKAKLQWAYGWNGFINAHQNDTKKMQWMEDTKKAIKDAGIEELGRLSQEEVGKLYQKASIFAYPTEFAEISCISALKAQATLCYPVATDFGALKQTIEWGTLIHSTKTKDTWNRPYQFHFGLEDELAQQQWIEAIVAALTQPREARAAFDPNDLISRYNWPTVAQQWDATFRI